MSDANTSQPVPSAAPQIQYQVELLAPIVLVVVSLIGLVYRQLSQRLERNEKRMECLEAKQEANTKEIGDKLDKVLDKLTDLAVSQANSKSNIFEHFVTKADCDQCRKN